MKIPPENTLPSAFFYLANLAPLPDPLNLAPVYLEDCPEILLRPGLEGLYGLITRLYRAAAQSPQDFALLASPRAKDRPGLTDRVFQSIPHLLYFLGLYGCPAMGDGQPGLRVDQNQLARASQAAKIKDYPAVLEMLGSFGVEVAFSNPLAIRFQPVPEIACALPVFARACRSFVKKETALPFEFGRADLRVLAYPPGKKKAVPVLAEEAIRLLDESQGAFIAGLDAWASSAGYRAEASYSTMHNASWRVNYRNKKLGKTLFGFTVESGRLAMHLNFNDSRRILPYILASPGSFQEVYFEKCACAECGSCQDGPLQVEAAGQVYRICGFSYLSLPEVPYEFQEVIDKLLRVQDNFLKQGAAA